MLHGHFPYLHHEENISDRSNKKAPDFDSQYSRRGTGTSAYDDHDMKDFKRAGQEIMNNIWYNISRGLPLIDK